MRARPAAVTVRESGGVTSIDVRPPAAAARIVVLVLAAVWAALTIVWVAVAAASRAPLAYAIGAGPFAVIGLLMTVRALAHLPSRAALAVDRGRRLLVAAIRGGVGISEGRRGPARIEVPLDLVGACRVDVAHGAGGLLRPALSLEAGARTLRIGEGLAAADLRRLADAVNAALVRARPSSAARAPDDSPLDSSPRARRLETPEREEEKG